MFIYRRPTDLKTNKVHKEGSYRNNGKELEAHILGKISPNWVNTFPKYRPPTPAHCLGPGQKVRFSPGSALQLHRKRAKEGKKVHKVDRAEITGRSWRLIFWGKLAPIG